MNRFLITVLILLVAGCTEPSSTTMTPGIRHKGFGTLPDGREATLYSITSPSGMNMEVTNYGGIITSLKVEDRDGRFDDVVLGFDHLEDYLSGSPYFGAIVGRYGNRISNGRFSLDGETYELAANDGQNHLHGGIQGFDKVLWDARPFSMGNEHGIIFEYDSPDGEEGYPGNLSAKVTYMMTADNRLIVSYQASTDKATPVNLTQHSYFNLAGPGSDSILDHVLMIAAEHITSVDAELIPTGDLLAVAGTPFDFRVPLVIGSRISETGAAGGQQLEVAGGYDHTYVLSGVGEGLRLAARVYEPTTGRIMEVTTREPGVQFYSGNFLDGNFSGKGGNVYADRSGFCLETQHFPDSPNQVGFPSTILQPGELYNTQTVFAFSTDADQ